MTTEILPTRVEEFIKQMMPWAHGHQIKAITKFVLAIIDKQTGNQAGLARTQGNQEAATKQLSRLIHNPRLKPKDFTKWLCLQVLANQVPRSGRVRLTIDWTSEDDQHLLVISLLVGRRALPIFFVCGAFSADETQPGSYFIKCVLTSGRGQIPRPVGAIIWGCFCKRSRWPRNCNSAIPKEPKICLLTCAMTGQH